MYIIIILFNELVQSTALVNGVNPWILCQQRQPSGDSRVWAFDNHIVALLSCLLNVVHLVDMGV